MHLVDSVVCTQPSAYISAVLLSLSTMLQLELPHVNVLTKVDLLPTYPPLGRFRACACLASLTRVVLGAEFSLEYYLEVQDLSYLEEAINEDPLLSARYRALTHTLCEVVEDFNLVAFQPLSIQVPTRALTHTHAGV